MNDIKFRCCFCGRTIERSEPAVELVVLNLWTKDNPLGDQKTQALNAHAVCMERLVIPHAMFDVELWEPPKGSVRTVESEDE